MSFLREYSFAAVVFRLVLAALMGGLLGRNREKIGRPAGIRTYYIVCLSAAAIMLLGQYSDMLLRTQWKDLALELGLKTDVSRYASKAVGGIGFLGAGAIIVAKNNRIKGLTTAACLWAAAVLGLVIGIGFYEAAVVAFVIILLSLKELSSIDVKLRTAANTYKYAVQLKDKDCKTEFLNNLKNLEINVESCIFDNDDSRVLNLVMHFPKYFTDFDFLKVASAMDDIKSIKRI